MDKTITLPAPSPFIKWAGGKGKLINQYEPYFPKFERYFEPFLGGGALFFHLQPEWAFLSDANGELTNAYKVVRGNCEELIEALTHYRECHNQEFYYWVRSSTFDDPVARAARFIYLNKTCFNGLYRENAKGHFNVPMGAYRNPTIFNPDLLRVCSLALRESIIHQANFFEVTEYADCSTDFVYFDPPYHPVSRTSFTGYTRYSFTEDDQYELLHTVKTLSRRKVKVMISNSDCEFIRHLYADFNVYAVQAPRSVNSNGKGRGKVSELLITNYRVSP